MPSLPPTPSVVPGASNNGAPVAGQPPSSTITNPNTYYVQNSQQAQAGAQGQTGTQSELSQYTDGQQQLQQQLPQTLQGLLNGSTSVPSTFTAPPVAFQALNDQFQNTLLPQYAATYGAGSPQGLSQQAQQNENLAANLYQTGVGQYQNLLGQVQNTAFTPVGQEQANAQNQNWQSQGNQNTLGYQGPSPLNALGTQGAATLLSALGLT